MGEQDIQCPVCGYYCLGKGGVDCIDKPNLVKFSDTDLTREQQLEQQLSAANERAEKWQALSNANQQLAEITAKRADRLQAEVTRLSGATGYCTECERLSAENRKLQARIDGSMKQEPVPADYVFSPEYDETSAGVVCVGGAYIPANKSEIEQGLSCKLYDHPIIPPDVEELQAEYDRSERQRKGIIEQFLSVQKENAELRKQLEDIRAPEVWAVQNRSSVMLFSTEELADKYISASPATVSGGFCKTRMQVMTPQPKEKL